MAQHIILGAVSTSSTFLDKKELPGDSHFKWEAIRSFLYLAEAFSSCNLNYDIFSGSTVRVPVYQFIIFATIVGMPYMCMEFFVKQYTGKIDLNESLNPLLKGVNYGIILQSTFWLVLHANDLADSVLFFISTLRPVPNWSECTKNFLHGKQECVPTKNITITCSLISQKLNVDVTSAYHNYRQLFLTNDRSVFTRRLFSIAIVWLCNFFLSTVSDQMLVKLFNLTYLFRNISTFAASIFVVGSGQEHLSSALKDLLEFGTYNNQIRIEITTANVLYVFGIGVVGVYDFGTLSPFTVVDNAVVMYTIVFTLMAFLRGIFIRIMYNTIIDCIDVRSQFGQKYLSHHYFLFVIMPLSSDFLKAQRLFTIYLYINIIMTLCAHLAAITGAISKMLHSEFKNVKVLYITGLICFFGFLLSVPIGMYIDQYVGYLYGLSTSMILLGILKAAIIMYFYGAEKFATDIHFWLGFKPTKYWIICWSLLPIVLLWLLIVRSTLATADVAEYGDMVLIAMVWVIFLTTFVVISEIRTVVKYIAINNLTALFRSSNKYGPPDSEERKRRRKYDEALSLRQCTHNCILLDDRFDCNHMPITYKPRTVDSRTSMLSSRVSEVSITHIFEAGPSRRSRLSEVLDVQSAQA